jgi:hypothetical protein
MRIIPLGTGTPVLDPARQQSAFEFEPTVVHYEVVGHF